MPPRIARAPWAPAPPGRRPVAGGGIPSPRAGADAWWCLNLLAGG